MNPIKGEALLTLRDGRKFVLVADHASLVAAAVQYTGQTKLKKLMSDMQPLLDERGQVALDEDGDPVKDTLPATAAFLFGMLSVNHPDITVRDATNLLLSERDAVTEALMRAVALGFPDMVKSGEVGNVQTPTSKTSGANGAKQGSTRKPSGKRPRATSR